MESHKDLDRVSYVQAMLQQPSNNQAKQKHDIALL